MCNVRSDFKSLKECYTRLTFCNQLYCSYIQRITETAYYYHCKSTHNKPTYTGLCQVTPNLVKSLQYEIKKDYSEGGGWGYLAPIVGQCIGYLVLVYRFSIINQTNASKYHET